MIAPTAPSSASHERVLHVEGLLGVFNAAGVLAPADVHVALRLTTLAAADAAAGAEADGIDGADAVALGCALAVRAPRLGHVCVDLATVATTVAVEPADPGDGDAHPAGPGADLPPPSWPDVATWCAALAASPLVDASPAGGPPDEGAADAAVPSRPLRLVGTRLYLDRLWRQEQRVAADLRARADAVVPAADADVLAAGVAALFTDGDAAQREAALTAVGQRLAVVVGGPGTGKTTTVARILALLVQQPTDGRPLRIALAAPTGRAAARLEEAIHAEARRLDVTPEVRARLIAVRAGTVHRLLGWRPDGRGRFRHDRHDRLPHDVVVVDEVSMLSLSLMASLLDAIRPQARLVLVGDPGQLASVEAGAVLADVVGPLADPPAEADADADAVAASADGPLAGSIAVLRTVHRHGGGIAALAAALRLGDAGTALDLLRSGGTGDLTLVEAEAHDLTGGAAALAPVREQVVDAGGRMIAAALAGDADAALDALASARLVCAHRRGPAGVRRWGAEAERWLDASVPGHPTGGGAWPVGRPLLVTRNDRGLRLSNGDTGVVIATPTGPRAAFLRGSERLMVDPSRLSDVTTVHAMTVHASQGSQLDRVAVILPPATSSLLTAELLLTAVTRARRQLVVVGSGDSIEAAAHRRIARASGLRDALWAGS